MGIQAYREGILNQLLILLNKAVTENKKAKEEPIHDLTEAVDVDLTATMDEITSVARPQIETSDPIDYLHGSLGLVPMPDS